MTGGMEMKSNISSQVLVAVIAAVMPYASQAHRQLTSGWMDSHTPLTSTMTLMVRIEHHISNI